MVEIVGEVLCDLGVLCGYNPVSYRVERVGVIVLAEGGGGEFRADIVAEGVEAVRLVAEAVLGAVREASGGVVIVRAARKNRSCRVGVRNGGGQVAQRVEYRLPRHAVGHGESLEIGPGHVPILERSRNTANRNFRNPA